MSSKPTKLQFYKHVVHGNVKNRQLFRQRFTEQWTVMGMTLSAKRVYVYRGWSRSGVTLLSNVTHDRPRPDCIHFDTCEVLRIGLLSFFCKKNLSAKLFQDKNLQKVEV